MSQSYNRVKRFIGIGGAVFIWFVITIIFTLRVFQTIRIGNPFEIEAIAFVLFGFFTMVGALKGDKIRRYTGLFWSAVAGTGFLFFILGIGMDFYWIGNLSIVMTLSGLVTAWLLFLPDQKP